MKRPLYAFVFLTIALPLLAMTLYMMSFYALPLLAGGMLALVIRPPYEELRRRGWGPAMAATAATTGLVILVLLPLVILSYFALKEAASVTQGAMTMWPQQLQHWWQLVNHWVDGLPFKIPHEDFNQYLMRGLTLAGNWASALLINTAANAPAALLQLTICILACYFLLLREEQLFNWLEPLFPLPRKVVREMRTAFRDTTQQTLIASLAAAVVQSLFVGITYLILGLPAVALAAGATFVFAWIPVLGSVPAFLVGGLILVAEGSWGKFSILLISAAITGLADNLVRPLVIRGGEKDLHPFVALLAIFGGIELFGMFGVVLGPVIVALSITCLNLWPEIAKLAGWWDFESDSK